jgi:hypothetical protein
LTFESSVNTFAQSIAEPIDINVTVSGSAIDQNVVGI